MALVQETTGSLIKGDILISNFNNSANLQGTGTTIMEISPQGAVQTFAQIDATKLPGGVPRRSWLNDRAGSPAKGMGHRGQLANHGWNGRHGTSRMPARVE
jgi:hypothetical protein